MSTSLIIRLAVWLPLISFVGCATFDWEKSVSWMKPGEEEPLPRPERIVALWSNATVHAPGKPPTRGFGGRLYFFDDQSRPTPVDGKLIVYAYDDNAPVADPSTPRRKYIFTADELKSHLSESDIGMSYSVWLPWDSEISGEAKEVSLLPVFISNEGQLVQGEQAQGLLPGRAVAKTPQWRRAEPRFAHSSVAPASYQHQHNGLPNEQPPSEEEEWKMRTATISVPMSMKKRLAQAGAVQNTSRPYSPNQRMGGWDALGSHRPDWQPQQPLAEQAAAAAAETSAPAEEDDSHGKRYGAQRVPGAMWPTFRPRHSPAPWRQNN